MSIVAWDGKILAADKLVVSGELRSSGTKIVRLETGEILAWTGECGGGMALVHWFKHGRLKEDWPEMQKTPDWTRLIVADESIAYFYEREPFPQIVADPFMAWGNGRDYAIGAMAMGADAKQAVEVANRFCISCGGGVDFFETARDRAP